MGCVAIGAMFSLAVFLAPMSDGDRLVARGHFVRDDHQLPRHGLRLVRLGRGERSLGRARRHAVRRGAARARAGARQPRDDAAVSFSSPMASRGLAASAFFAPMIATVTGWFETRRNLAVSLVSAGMGMAPLTISPLASWLITHYGWRAAMFVHRRARLGAADSGCNVRAAAAGGRHAAPTQRRPPTADRQDRRRQGADLTAVPGAGLHLHAVLRGAFGADLPHGELRDVLRHRRDGGGERLQRRRPRGARRPRRCSACSRIASAPSACW